MNSSIKYQNSLKFSHKSFLMKSLIMMDVRHQLVIAVAMCVLSLIQFSSCQLTVGFFYPIRPSLNALQTESAVCRVITDHIRRNSARFNSELVTNNNGRINFQIADARIMSSRMQSRLDTLASRYFSATSRRMTIQKAWTPFPDSQLNGVPGSLHYEGRSVRVQLPAGSNYDQFLQMAVAAAFDWVFYQNANYVRLSVIPSRCRRNIDGVFMLDRSSSVRLQNHMIALQFINTAISFFNIGRDASRIGLVAYATAASIQFDLDDHITLSSLQTAVSRVVYTAGSTNTPAALNNANFLLNPNNRRGARSSLEGIPKIAILITDGFSNRGNLNAAAPDLRNAGVQVYTVGIGRINLNQLRLIASDPDNEHIFILRNFLDAAGFVDFLSVTTCDAPAIIQPGDNTTTVITDGGITYFQTSCPIFSDSVLVELTDVNGLTFLFASNDETNPGPLTISTMTNTTTGITRRTVTLTLRGNSKVVYIGCQGQTASNRFTINVWDRLFDPDEAFIDVVEGVRAGVTIYETQANLTAAAAMKRYTYSIIEGNEDGIFSIDSSNGRVFIPTSGSPGVNFDRQPAHILTVQAENNAQSCQRGRIIINIRVISNRINFNRIPPTIQVMETSRIGDTVVQVMATGGAGRIQYSIVDGNGAGDFRIDANTGVLRVNRMLNFAITSRYRLVIRAVSVGTTVRGDQIVSISIQDINEPPVFNSCTMSTGICTYNIDENRPPTTLGQIMVSDPDSSSVPNGMLSYRVSMGGLPFEVDPSGNLRTTAPLDSEVRMAYRFTVIIMDGCPGCALSISVDVLVTVNDLNDNSPVFTLAPSTARIREDSQQGTVVAEYRATDADNGANAVIIFTLSPSNIPFTLSPMGTLSLTGDIDFEVTQTYTVTITASNNGVGPPSISVNTFIQIVNVNDNAPMIVGEPYTAVVEEGSAINTLVLTVTAVDEDVGSQIQYLIISGNLQNYFALNRNSGVLSVNANIDREITSSVSLLVEARDRGTPQPNSDRTTITITISDINDNPPLFRPDTYSAQVREDQPVGQNVIQVLATDADEPNTPNANIIFSFRSGNSADNFRILRNGQIQIKNALDFEITSSYALVVEARDGGDPVLSATASVSITVINVNENPPTLTGDQAVDVSEATPIGSTIAVFQAQDQDQMAITISIVSGNDEGRFAIGVMSGIITLVASLDFEATTNYTLLIRASDGQLSTDATFSVTITDENEFSPMFMGPTAFTIREEQQAGSIVGTVMAIDGDREAVLTYGFVRQDTTTENFILDPSTGVITTRRVLNREIMIQVFIPPLSQVIVQISAMDDGSPSRRTIRDYTITLEDINDNAPIFSDQSYSNQLLENLPPGEVIFITSVTDADIGSNGQVNFIFTLTNNQGPTNPFRITETGTIVSVEVLDYELQQLYLFSITVRDRGSPSLSSTVSGNLSLIDVNDNAPLFSQDTYHISVSEDFIPGDMLLTFVATDADSGVNGEVEYFVMSNINILFLEGSTETVFQIDRDSGALSTLNLFDFESAPQVNISIFANDRGLPQLTGTATLVINVTNIDEEPPQFQPMSCDVTVSEDISIGTIVSSCSATDPDTIATGDQLPVTFALTNQFFEVNPDNGNISTIALLDRERNGGITLRITVTDLSGRSASRRVVIRITDVNDTPPQFMGSPYQFFFSDGAIQMYTQEFLTLQIVDPDLGSNGTFTVSIGRSFQLTATETTVEVIAQDNGSPQMTSSTNVTVTFQSPCQLQTYSITNGGRLSAQLLCTVEVTPSPSFPVVFGRSQSLTCRIVSNNPTEYQWLHNGTTFTNTELVGQGRMEITLTLSDFGFIDTGEYACIASSQAGSLQSPATTANIQVSPTIITPPQDTAVGEGDTASFTCSAVGIPPPTIQWFKDAQRVGEGNIFNITSVDFSSAGIYTCGVSNAAGNAAASAMLVVFDVFSVLQLNLMAINKPNSEANCQYFDPSELEAIISSVTDLRVMVTKVSGSNLCDINPCSPSPCNNGGTCSLRDVTEGYECTCIQGYSGVNCSLDINECDLDACGMDGECSNTRGSFICTCKQNITGRRCQFQDSCSNNPCSGQDETCLEDSSVQGYQCQTLNASFLTVGMASVTLGQLDDLIQDFFDRELQAASNGPTTIELIPTSMPPSNQLITQCEPRFSPYMDGSVLLWVCPPDEPQPSAEQQQMLCAYLLTFPNLVTQCKPPLGDVITPPTKSSVPSTSVMVNLVFIDKSNEPLDATETIRFLENEKIREELAKRGFTASATGLKPLAIRPEKKIFGINTIIGYAVGGLAGLVLIALIMVVTVWAIKRGMNAERSRKQLKKKRALQLIELEPGFDGLYNKMATSTSTQKLISGGYKYADLPPKKQGIRDSTTTSIEGECIYGNVEETSRSNGMDSSDYCNLEEKKC